MLIETAERKAQLRDGSIAEFLGTSDINARKAFMEGFGIFDVKLPSLEGGNLDHFMERLIQRCAIVAPWELENAAAYVVAVSKSGGPNFDCGFRLDSVIPDLIYSAACIYTGDMEFWKDKKNMEAFIRAFPAAKAKYEKKLFQVKK